MSRLIVRLLFVDTVHIAWILGGFGLNDGLGVAGGLRVLYGLNIFLHLESCVSETSFMTKLDRCGSLVVLLSLSTTIKLLMLFRTQFSKSTELSVALVVYESSRSWILNHSETMFFDVCCHLWGVKPHRSQTRLRFPLEQMIWSRFWET